MSQCVFLCFCLYCVSSGFTPSCPVPVTGTVNSNAGKGSLQLSQNLILLKLQGNISELNSFLLSVFLPPVTYFQCSSVNLVTHSLHVGQSLCFIQYVSESCSCLSPDAWCKSPCADGGMRKRRRGGEKDEEEERDPN